MTRATTLMIAASLLALGACAKKPPKELPPPPAETTGPVTTDSASGVVVPGSQEDFVATVSSDRIFFDTDSAEVDGPDQSILQSQAAWLGKYADKRITIEGHADERGTREYNLALGERRANATKNALIALGIATARVTTVSYGKERPDATGSDEEAFAKNRRAVTVTVQ